jgi:hypothetical protein
LTFFEQASRSSLLRLAPVSGAPALTLTRVLGLTTAVARLAAALSLTFVLAFARVFAFFRIVRQGLEGDPRFFRRARGIGSHGERPSQKAGNSRASNYCFGWFNHVVTFLFVVSVCLHEAAASRESLRIPGFPVSLGFPTWSEEIAMSLFREELIFSAGEALFSEAKPTVNDRVRSRWALILR